MKFGEKIYSLRKMNGLSQENLSEICDVSRQSISKWEANLTLPEYDKLIILSNTFRVSTDVLLRDELALSDVKEVHCCGADIAQEGERGVFEGLLIKESIDDENILDHITVHKTELWNTGGRPKYWTVLYFSTSDERFPDLISKALISDENRGGNWFVDFKRGNVKYVVFKNKILSYHIGNAIEKNAVCDECRRMGISDDQMMWSE